MTPQERINALQRFLEHMRALYKNKPKYIEALDLTEIAIERRIAEIKPD